MAEVADERSNTW